MSGVSVFDTVVKILGRSEVTVENVLGICELSENSITFRTKKGALEIKGDKLVIKEAREGAFSIVGEVNSVIYM